MEIIIALVITVLTALFITLPFFLRSKDVALDGNGAEGRVDPLLERVNVLQGRKESLYSAIRDIDLDYGLGKLTEEDYEELRLKYRLEAASVLKEIDDITKGSGMDNLDSEIEAEIKKHRGVVSPSLQEDEIENEILSTRNLGASNPARSEFSAWTGSGCPDCGHASSPGDVFCSKCGAKINE